jgi:hypothetical protein
MPINPITSDQEQPAVPGWYTVEVVSTAHPLPDAKASCSGTAPIVAAWLRAMADQIDPQPRTGPEIIRQALSRSTSEDVAEWIRREVRHGQQDSTP